MFHQGQATDYIDMLVQLEDLAVNSHVDAIVLNVGGTGWAVGDLFDINGGTVVGGHNATGEVLTEAAGVALTVRIFSGGAYTASPGVAATTTAISPAVGINLTVDATIAATGWAVNRSQILVAPERELLLQGVGSGTDEIFIGFETKRNVGASTFYWELAGNTGFDNGQTFDNQPGTSRQGAETDDCTTPMNNGILDYFLVVDSFHIKCVFKSGSSYTNLYIGFVNQFATPGEYPYPLCLIGCSSAPLRNVPYNNSSIFLSGMHDPQGFASTDDGPGAIREVDGQWYRLLNAYQQASAKATLPDRKIWPAQTMAVSTAPITEINRFCVAVASADPASWFGNKLQTTPAHLINATPDTGGDIPFLWPTVIYQLTPAFSFLGELMDVHPVSVQGLGAVSEDTLTDANGDVYMLFQNCNRTDNWAFFAIKRTF